MKNKLIVIGVGLVILLLFVMFQILFVVKEGEVAVVTTFGKPETAKSEPGLYLKWPWPVQDKRIYDNRVHCLEGGLEQTLTKDGHNLMLKIYAGWRISDPMKFLERVKAREEAESQLRGLLRNYKNSVVGQHKFSDLVSVDKDAIKLVAVEQKILDAVKPEALDLYGIEMTLLGIRQIGVPQSVTDDVFDRMRKEREKVAENHRQEGEERAAIIRAEADKERDIILAKAWAKAKRIKAEGEAEAAEHYAVFQKNPELAIFLRKLEVFEETLKTKATVVLDTDMEPYDLLYGTKSLPKK